MAEFKTKETAVSFEKFLVSVKDPRVREDCRTIANLMQKATKEEPKIWGAAIVGFGKYLYKYGSGREGEWPVIGFSPRAKNLTLYMLGALSSPEGRELLKKLGKHKTGKGCLYINKLEDVDKKVLQKLMKVSIKTNPFLVKK